ncbi:hypothetical protein B0J11DRAFT_503643 [Dendryphion nanum]|uniref:Uncharacterized protein n=1 Tax=Dendryphion nanum TaxID=256645 RepID=A0A9P9E4W5_9PLEO|nr:hypothetical protein B0J11DRAFT_503643 [Dendryphion nanum]
MTDDGNVKRSTHSNMKKWLQDIPEDMDAPTEWQRPLTPTPIKEDSKHTSSSERDDGLEKLLKFLSSLQKTPTDPWRTPFRPLRLPKRPMVKIFMEVFGLNSKFTEVQFESMENVSSMFQICWSLTRIMQTMYEKMPVHINTPFPPHITRQNIRRLSGLRYIYERIIPELIVTARVVQLIPYARREDIEKKILSLPGIHHGSQLIVPDLHLNTIQSFSVVTPKDLARLLCKSPHSEVNRYIGQFVPENHLNLFGWTEYAGLTVRNLTVKILGADLWNRHSFTRQLYQYRALHLISLMASIIANWRRYGGLQNINITGMGEFGSEFEEMWDNIPFRTPILGSCTLLDQLCYYPFVERLPTMYDLRYDGWDGTLRFRKREGNLFGMRNMMEWQLQIMEARYGKRAPTWEFEEDTY